MAREGVAHVVVAASTSEPAGDRTLDVPDWQVAAWIASYLALAAGELERSSDTVSRLTGSDPIALETSVRERPQSLAHLRPDSAG